MQMNAYLSFRGDCEAAFTFYAACLVGTLGEIFRHAGTPLAEQVPAEWQNKVMHGNGKSSSSQRRKLNCWSSSLRIRSKNQSHETAISGSHVSYRSATPGLLLLAAKTE